tara:strand:+ start:352 stop:558 length:207 start_codon:yes stop_codon:yes gene_type:complete
MNKLQNETFDRSETVIDMLLMQVRYNEITADEAVYQAFQNPDVKLHWEKSELITIFNRPKDLYPITEH